LLVEARPLAGRPELPALRACPPGARPCPPWARLCPAAGRPCPPGASVPGRGVPL